MHSFNLCRLRIVRAYNDEIFKFKAHKYHGNVLLRVQGIARRRK